MTDPRIKAATHAIRHVRQGAWGMATSRELAVAAIKAADATPARPEPRTADMDHVVEAIRTGSASPC